MPRPIAATLLLVTLLSVPAARLAAQTTIGAGPPVVVEQSSGYAEAAVASCAAGAAIGYIAVLATGVGSPAATATLFCGLSVAAGAAGSIAAWTWRSLTGTLTR